MSHRLLPGFTLIELLVVIAVISALTAFVPRLLDRLPSIRLRAARGDMMSTLRQVRDQALASGVPAEIVMSQGTSSYVLSVAGSHRKVADLVDSLGYRPVGSRLSSVPIRLRFFPDGSATGGVLLLGHADQVLPVTINGFTGRIGWDE